MKQIFINLPVQDLNASMSFYEQLGFTVNPLFTFEDQKCMVWSDQIYLMLQSKEMFAAGNYKNLADAFNNTIATFTLPLDSLDLLNEMMERSLQAGGKEPNSMVDEGFMILRSLEDLDGHQWGLIHLDIEKFKQMRGK